jgi:hypothetical protein
MILSHVLKGLENERVEEVLLIGRACGPNDNGIKKPSSLQHVIDDFPRVAGHIITLHT